MRRRKVRIIKQFDRAYPSVAFPNLVGLFCGGRSGTGNLNESNQLQRIWPGFRNASGEIENLFILAQILYNLVLRFHRLMP